MTEHSNFAKEKVNTRGDLMENNDDKRYTGKGNKVILYNILEIHRLFSFSKYSETLEMLKFEGSLGKFVCG